MTYIDRIKIIAWHLNLVITLQKYSQTNCVISNFSYYIQYKYFFFRFFLKFLIMTLQLKKVIVQLCKKNVNQGHLQLVNFLQSIGTCLSTHLRYIASVSWWTSIPCFRMKIKGLPWSCICCVELQQTKQTKFMSQLVHI